MFGFGILSGLTFLPLVGAAFILTQRGDSESSLRNIRWAALLTTIATFALSVVVWQRFDASNAAFQLIEEKAWFGSGSFTNSRRRFLDPFVLLTTFLMPFAISPPGSRSPSASANI